MVPIRKLLKWTAVTVAAGAVSLLLVGGVALAVIYPKLPDVSSLSDYRPKLPLRIFSAEGTLIGEFGEERRTLTPIASIPKSMKDAVLAVEDARFYEHGGVDSLGLMRAVLANLRGGMRQGASTITQQVARNVYLSSERTLSRKVYEALLAFKLESRLSKDQILEIYLNQIYLGNRAYGFAAASEVYFGKPLQDITVAEAAMLAGLPKSPGTANPINSPTRARARQLHVIDRMKDTGFITAAQADEARQEPLHLRDASDPNRPHAEYVAETVRQLMYAQYGDSIYTRGLSVQTTLVAADQQAAYRSLRKGIMDYERRQTYRGPEAFVDLPDDPKALDDAVDDALADHPDNDDVMSAVVLTAAPKLVTAVRGNGDILQITGDGLRLGQLGLSDKAGPNIKVRRGAVIRVMKAPRNTWEMAQLPEVEGAFVAVDPRDGAIKAMVGGFDFGKSKMNRVTQAWRQPGSSFKPFIYSAALEKGFTPVTLVNDAPLFFDAATIGGQPWEPKNFEGTYDGPMSLRHALQESKNLVTIRVLQSIGTAYAQDWITRFGFDKDKHPAYLPMGLGAGSVTPMQMATAYSVFANGGHRVDPHLVVRVTDRDGKVLSEVKPPVLDESNRAIPERNAYLMDSLLQSVMKSGTGAKAYQALKRDDIYGKTGTTNDSVDTWFAAFQPTMVGIAWVGYDTPRKLGVRGETGGSLSLPIWVGYMQAALKGVKVAEVPEPPGLMHADGEVFFDDYGPGRGVASLGLDANPTAPAETLAGEQVAPVAPVEERNRILDMFK
ncbi:penicillin-binding protein 1A [Variovorax sp. PAMC28562]|uniref:penicillin-binding protein 1A n=1 Tax=Variovorax sp. PAMC28562 TaxID=2762323 RepID=UPI00164E045F|nr:penicillin-binding protein 1A [Variovorax sp. PAMC28562]QNK74723.1 penicillin-binding protein 1A [Variovorax sp. PAMC28562]